jgi:hypothetical protein
MVIGRREPAFLLASEAEARFVLSFCDEPGERSMTAIYKEERRHE